MDNNRVIKLDKDEVRKTLIKLYRDRMKLLYDSGLDDKTTKEEWKQRRIKTLTDIINSQVKLYDNREEFLEVFTETFKVGVKQ